MPEWDADLQGEKVMSDIVERLANAVDARDEIERLRAENDRLRGRAALSVVYEAIREPTPVMISAGENSEYAGGTMGGALGHANYGGLPVAYRAMIDASAVKPGER